MYGPNARYSRHGNWSSCYIEGGDISEQLSNCEVLTEVSFVWRYSTSAKAATVRFFFANITTAE